MRSWNTTLRLMWLSYELSRRVDVVENTAVLHGALHSARPERFRDRRQRDHALRSAFGQHVALDLLPAWLGHVGAVVDHEHGLVRNWEQHHGAAIHGWGPVNSTWREIQSCDVLLAGGTKPQNWDLTLSFSMFSSCLCGFPPISSKHHIVGGLAKLNCSLNMNASCSLFTFPSLIGFTVPVFTGYSMLHPSTIPVLNAMRGKSSFRP